MKRFLSILAASVFLCTLAFPALASEKTKSPPGRATTSSAKAETNAAKSENGTHKAKAPSAHHAVNTPRHNRKKKS